MTILMSENLYLDKILTQIVCPLGLTLTLGFLGLVLLPCRRRLAGAGLLVVALTGLSLSSLPVVAETLIRSLEARYPELPASELPAVEAVIVLGGGLHPRPETQPYPDLQSGADRVWHAARIFHAGKAPRVILSGGTIPWLNTKMSEASAMQMFLADLGVPFEAMLLEERSRNTHENAAFTAQLLREAGITKVLLVTSAIHMPRAMATFRVAGVKAIAASTDFMLREESASLLHWLPDAQALALSTAVFKEYIGLWVYRSRGWA